jgi:hypothetical protein
MKTILTTSIAILFMQFAYAGSGVSIIKGKSGTGRTQIEIHTSEIDDAVTYLKYTIDDKSYEFNLMDRKSEETYGYIIHDKKNQVFTIFVDNKKIDFKFWMIPGTRKTEKDNPKDWTFFAYVQGTDPREYTEETRNHPMSPEIYLYCTLDYRL